MNDGPKEELEIPLCNSWVPPANQIELPPLFGPGHELSGFVVAQTEEPLPAPPTSHPTETSEE
jgi:hypothetical protein